MLPFLCIQPLLGATVALVAWLTMRFSFKGGALAAMMNSSPAAGGMAEPLLGAAAPEVTWLDIAFPVATVISILSALVLAGFGDMPMEFPPVNSVIAKCGCPWILGTTSLPPTYQMLFSQVWVTMQAGLTGFAVNAAKFGRLGAMALAEADGQFGLSVIGSAANVSNLVWKPMLAMHISHFFLILYRTLQEDVTASTAFHKTFFTYVASGAVSFVVFGTVGAWACEALVLSASKQQVYTTTMKEAKRRHAAADADGDGFLNKAELQKAGEGLVDFNSHYKYCAKVCNYDPNIGLDVKAFRLYCLLKMPMYLGPAVNTSPQRSPRAPSEAIGRKC